MQLGIEVSVPLLHPVSYLVESVHCVPVFFDRVDDVACSEGFGQLDQFFCNFSTLAYRVYDFNIRIRVVAPRARRGLVS